MPTDIELSVIWNFATALLIGALVGIEREKRKSEERENLAAGLRTFIVIALIGAVGGYLSKALATPAILVIVLAVVAAAILTGYVLAARIVPTALGLTSELAGIAVCLLGAMAALGHRELATALAVATAAVLAYKQPLHGLVARIGWDDVFIGLRLLIASFIVLPLLPDHPVDPWQALNPYKLWLLVVMISAMSLVGYIATRWLGTERGNALTGLTGGLVSSTAVTLTFARRGRDPLENPLSLVSGILLAWTIMFARIIVIAALVNAALVPPLAIPMAAMGLVNAVFAAIYYWRSTRTAARDGKGVPLTNPFSLSAAIEFAALIAFVLLLVKAVQLYLPDGGLYIVAAMVGITDVDAITLSMGDYARTHAIHIAVMAIVIAALSNTVVKCGIVVALSGRALHLPMLLATVPVLAVGLGVILLVPA